MRDQKEDFVTFNLPGLLSKWGFDATYMFADFYEKTGLDDSVVSADELLHHTAEFILEIINGDKNTDWKIEYIHSSGNCTRIHESQQEDFEKWVHTQDYVAFLVEYGSIIFLYAEVAALKWKGASETAYYFRSIVDEIQEEGTPAKTAVVDLNELLKLVDSESTIRRNRT